MCAKYLPPPPVELPDRQWPSRVLDHAPQWCSVDLRDGNQALPNPLSPTQKLAFFDRLVKIGFKHIEIAFPSASQDDFDFTRRLIDENRIPGDVFVMGLTQCREELVARTGVALAGAPRAILHAYLATSDLHLKQVFGLGRDQAIARAVATARQAREMADAMPDRDLRFEFSPEEFTDTDPAFALEISLAVFEAWGRATPEKPLILNLPATVERRPPNQYADLVEWFLRRYPHRDRTTISLHAHNDQGMAVAATELALLAGADRVEGTLFGHGERTGNVCLVTLASNLAARGIETGLDFADLPALARETEERCGLPVAPRHPYAGELVFTAFSGSHQDAIRKGLAARETAVAAGDGGAWHVPYLHVDPADLGREYEKIIRINSQSGKGGVAWVLEHEFGVSPPKNMHPELGRAVQALSDRLGREVSGDEVWEAFRREFVQPAGRLELVGFWPVPDRTQPSLVRGELRVKLDGKEITTHGRGNGPLSAFTVAAREATGIPFNIADFHQQSVGAGADATAYAFVLMEIPGGARRYGVGADTNIDQAAVAAAVAAINRLLRSVPDRHSRGA